MVILYTTSFLRHYNSAESLSQSGSQTVVVGVGGMISDRDIKPQSKVCYNTVQLPAADSSVAAAGLTDEVL